MNSAAASEVVRRPASFSAMVGLTVSCIALTLGALGLAVVQPDATGQLFPGNCTYEPLTTSWLDQQSPTWAAARSLPIATGELLQAASYGNPETPGDSLATMQADLAMLRASGAQVIRIDLNFQPWLEQNASLIAEMEAIVHQVRVDGLQLMIADSASETYWHHPLAWSSFANAAVEREGTLAALFHPDYYVVVKEPGWYYPMIAGYPLDPTVESVTNWVDLTQQLISTVRAVSPSTQIGVAVAAASLYSGGPSTSLSYLESMRNMPGLDFLGFDIYGVCDMENTVRFLSQEGTGGKAIWVPEAWSSSGSGVYDPSQSSVDVQWVEDFYEFLNYIGARGVGLFYTDVLAQFAPPSASSWTSYYSERTPVFYGVQNATDSAGRLSFPVHAGSTSSNCPSPTIASLRNNSSSSINQLPAGEFSLQATSCQGYVFQAWTFQGDVAVSSSMAPVAILSVYGPGNVTAVYAPANSVGIAVIVYPASCASAATSVGGSSTQGGGYLILGNGTYVLAPGNCPEEPLAQVVTSGNVSEHQGSLSVHGPGAIVLVYSPVAPSAELLSLPWSLGLGVLLPPLLVVMGALAALVWDRRHRPPSRKGASPLSPLRGKSRRAGRWALGGFFVQAVTAIVVGLSLLRWWVNGYSLGGVLGATLVVLGEAILMVFVLLLYLAWTRLISPVRQGGGEMSPKAARWMVVVGGFAGLGIAGLLYFLAVRSAASDRSPP